MNSKKRKRKSKTTYHTTNAIRNKASYIQNVELYIDFRVLPVTSFYCAHSMISSMYKDFDRYFLCVFYFISFIFIQFSCKNCWWWKPRACFAKWNFLSLSLSFQSAAHLTILTRFLFLQIHYSFILFNTFVLYTEWKWTEIANR